MTQIDFLVLVKGVSFEFKVNCSTSYASKAISLCSHGAKCSVISLNPPSHSYNVLSILHIGKLRLRGEGDLLKVTASKWQSQDVNLG